MTTDGRQNFRITDRNFLFKSCLVTNNHCTEEEKMFAVKINSVFSDKIYVDPQNNEKITWNSVSYMKFSSLAVLLVGSL